ncbi:hypothetical protein LCGC14_0783840 [marine sediment metagenome]|uniref:CAAX prenyl protease 2/Lysostaphin resistance protein A-like domain-containing protein n=1 Tax=marine sediment metagenome TaxID=412755 RepID=A0A0F9T1Q2_9ZZZZ
MTDDNKTKIKYCVYCGGDVGTNETYCPGCGKFIVKLKESENIKNSQIKKSVSLQKIEISRKCSGCGSIINSTVLNQCPICNTKLENISEAKKISIQKKPGLIFINKKLEPEQKFILKTDSWTLKEGFNVFSTSVYIYIITFFLIYFLVVFQDGGGSIDQNIQMFLLSQTPEILFGIYPLYYIFSKNHKFKKLGFYKDSKKILIGTALGIIGLFSLILINILFNSLISTLASFGLDFFETSADLAVQTQILRNADFIWIFLLIILIGFGAVSSEIVYRGVLHNTLKQKFDNNIYVILIVALIYSVLMLILYPNPTYFLLNFLGFVIIGIIYEVTNGNIYSTIVANVLYNILLIILIFV